MIIEQKQPLAADQPKVWISRYRHTARDTDGIVTAELRHVDLGLRRKRRPIAEIAEAPDRAAAAQFELRVPGLGLPSVKQATGS